MARRMTPPAVAEDLRRLGIARVSTLLARQVHSDEGQLAFAGDGPINTDDHNLLEYLSPIAYFMSGEAVALYDERTAGGAPERLAFTSYVRAHPLEAAAWGELYETLDFVHDDSDPLLRSVAQRWLHTAPGEFAPSVAAARTQLAQGDVDAALQTLAPLVGLEDPEPAAMNLQLRALVKQNERASTLFTPLDLAPTVRRARDVLAKHPGAADLAETLEAFAGP
jgi:hypothetical protein